VHADTVQVTAAEAVSCQRRPPLIAVTFTAADAPALSYLLEARPAFDFADGLARIAFELEPRILAELRTRTIVLPHERI
jgi:hypothetical protein